MGKKFEKHFKENELFCFGAPKEPCRFPIGDLGGSDPVSSFGRQNRTNTRVAPAQIEVFGCGLFAARSGLVGCSEGLYLEERQNAKGMFRPEHCMCFSVLPR